MHVPGCYYYANIKLNLSIALIAGDEKVWEKKCSTIATTAMHHWQARMALQWPCLNTAQMSVNEHRNVNIFNIRRPISLQGHFLRISKCF